MFSRCDHEREQHRHHPQQLVSQLSSSMHDITFQRFSTHTCTVKTSMNSDCNLDRERALRRGSVKDMRLDDNDLAGKGVRKKLAVSEAMRM